ncbi:sodium:solute symporter family protein [Stutzerimonas tarimensis]|uniref:Sodium:solute symporter n=1 Tax=Stutzerimonas tarimensis TaxID=1507735 RepID=A0ABV7TB08_9GAMM
MTSTTLLTLGGIAAYMVLMFVIGFFAFRKNKQGDATDWFLMGRNTNLVMLVGTLFATWFSTFAFLGGPGTFYLTGVEWLLFGFFNSMGPVLVMLIGTRIWRLGKQYGYITPADLLSDYYDDSRRLRLLTGIVCILVLFPYAAIQLSGISIALQSISGGLIRYEMGIFGLAICVALYAVFGGSRAVVWTDTIQGFIFAALLIATAALMVHWAGGWSTGWSAAVAADPSKFAFDEQSSGGRYVTLMLLWTFGWILTPHLWQRLYMADSPKTLVTSSVLASILALFVVTFSGAVIGFLAIGMDLPLPEGFSSDALVPLIYANFLPIMGAVLVVAVFAAGMSTLDSQIISASSVYCRDYYRQRASAGSDKQMLRASRGFEVGFVVAVVLFSLSEAGRQLLIPLASIGVGLALVFLMPLLGALFWPRASETGAFWAMLSGTVVMLALQFGLSAYTPGSIGPAMWGFLTSAVVFYGVSLSTRPVSEAKLEKFHGFMATRFPEPIEAALEQRG